MREKEEVENSVISVGGPLSITADKLPDHTIGFYRMHSMCVTQLDSPSTGDGTMTPGCFGRLANLFI
jgi:hypothetical protein